MKGTQNYLYASEEGFLSFVLVYFQDRVVWIRRSDQYDGFYYKKSSIKEDENIEHIFEYKSLITKKPSFKLIER